ncbi:uncharacterized protein LOC113213333 [Frankliniella occidentalis]|uniref:Uncharacterized protein LOC113213333 n=1 Tax=Frankliniella occidentalis TaxID=133901 RepID=A0A6J1T3I4_FRAOC|nr:uncharacterized protein LOC113213333 [Frankliniella occidentalis]
MVYIGSGNYITKREMVTAEKEKSYRGRLTQVVALILKHPERYNLTGSEGMDKVTDEHLEAIHGFLTALKWKRINLNPMKVGNRVLQPLSEEFVRRTVSKYLSEIAKKPNDNEQGTKRKKTNLKDDGASKKKRNKDMKDGASKKKRNEEINGDTSEKKGDEDEDDDEDDDDMIIRKKRKLDDSHSDSTELEDVSFLSIPESGIVS